jgi:hypothetical protein
MVGALGGVVEGEFLDNRDGGVITVLQTIVREISSKIDFLGLNIVRDEWR